MHFIDLEYYIITYSKSHEYFPSMSPVKLVDYEPNEFALILPANSLNLPFCMLSGLILVNGLI